MFCHSIHLINVELGSLTCRVHVRVKHRPRARNAYELSIVPQATPYDLTILNNINYGTHHHDEERPGGSVNRATEQKPLC